MRQLGYSANQPTAGWNLGRGHLRQSPDGPPEVRLSASSLAALESSAPGSLGRPPRQFPFRSATNRSSHDPQGYTQSTGNLLVNEIYRCKPGWPPSPRRAAPSGYSPRLGRLSGPIGVQLRNGSMHFTKAGVRDTSCKRRGAPPICSPLRQSSQWFQAPGSSSSL